MNLALDFPFFRGMNYEDILFKMDLLRFISEFVKKFDLLLNLFEKK
jgi:hypothetical protein